MIFLSVLVVATAAAAIVGRARRPRRDVARSGLGLALIVAGATHFVDPVPFEQHLPSWTPAASLVVLASGVLEVALGTALLAPLRHQRDVGRVVALFFVAVFPANVHVAVSGVEVDGQPGGLYPWLRLPLQILFVAWALWSTADPASPPTRGVMPRLGVGGAEPRPGDGAETVVMASLLVLRRIRDVPSFLAAALRIRALVGRTDGAIGSSLTAVPLRRTFWTLSQWRSQDDLDGFARHPDHVAIMRRFGPRMERSAFATWTEVGSTPPTWESAHAAIDRSLRSTSA